MGQSSKKRMLALTPSIEIDPQEIELKSIRSQGSGGQKVNKTSNAVHLFFDIEASSLSLAVKERLLSLRDHRISEEGVVVIKAQESRSLEANREAAFGRLGQLIQSVLTPPKKRRQTKPSKRARARRLDSKAKRSRVKSLRAKPKSTD